MGSREAEDLGGLVDNAEPVAVEQVSLATKTEPGAVTPDDGSRVGCSTTPSGGTADSQDLPNENNKSNLPPGVALYMASGKKVVVTTQRQSIQPKPCPVKTKNIKYLYIFSVITIMLFFPTGCLALAYAIKTQRQMTVGAAKQDWTLCSKYSKRCQNFIIFSFIGFFVTLAITIAILEMTYFEHDDEYWDHRLNGRAFG